MSNKRDNFLLFMLVGIYSYTTFTTFGVRASCITIPISLSNLTSCDNGFCDYTQTATFALPAIDGSSACLELISPDGQSSTITANISLSHAHYVNLFDTVYFTDSPSLDFQGACSCDSNSFQDCNNCAASVPLGNFYQCTSGTIGTQGGVCSSMGSWCGKVGYSGYNRFKIFHASTTPKKDFGFLISVGNKTVGAEYEGLTQQHSLLNDSISVTIVSDTSSPPIYPEFVVFDRAVQNDFYFFGSDSVNSINGYDSNKIGYYKTSVTPQIPITFTDNTFEIYPEDCASGLFSVKYTAIDTATFLNNNPIRRSNAFAPNSLLVDPDWNPQISDTNTGDSHLMSQYQYLETGWMFASSTGNPIFFGIQRNGEYAPTVDQVDTIGEGVTFKTNLGNTVNLIAGSNFAYGQVTVLDATSSPASSTPLWLIDFQYSGRPGEYAICYGSLNQAGCGNNKTFTALSWPMIEKTQFTWNQGFYFKDIAPVHNISSSYLVTESNTGAVLVTMSFNNFKIKFDSQSVSPVIKSIWQDDTNLKVTAYSSTVSGECMFGSVPAGIITTQMISLTLSPVELDFVLVTPQTESEVTFILQCYKKQAQTTAYISINQLQNSSTTNIVENFRGRFVDFFSPSSDSFFSVGDLFDIDLPSFSSWKSMLYTILLWVAIAIGAIIAIIVIFYLIKFIIYLIKLVMNKSSKRYYTMKFNRNPTEENLLSVRNRPDIPMFSGKKLI